MFFLSWLNRLLLRWLGPSGFSRTLLNSQNSNAYSAFCVKVYGRNLCQFNMVDEEQLQKLLAVVSLGPRHRVLDLGCGMGIATEYISDVTGANIVGIDFANGAVNAANHRTRAKRERLEFRVGNLNQLPTDLGTFDCVMAVDTLYFMNDLKEGMGRIRTLLKPGGQFAAFYSAAQDSLEQALRAAGFQFEAWDFTANERRIWSDSLTVAEELKEQFIREGNFSVYKGRIQEGRRMLAAMKQEGFSRQLFHARTRAPE